MIITEKLKERFCKDYNLPLKIYSEPYFSSRIALMNDMYESEKKWAEFTETLEHFRNEQEYMEYYNQSKDKMINSVKNSEKYQQFNSMEIPQIKNNTYNSVNIYKEKYTGKRLLSADMKKSNFTVLHYNGIILAENYEDFVKQFVNPDFKNIINSKYIRQVVFGNCNPKRQLSLSRFYMYQKLEKFINDGIFSAENVISLSEDEIIISLDNNVKTEQLENYNNDMINLKYEIFEISKINGTDGYLRKIYDLDGNYKKSVLKCFSPTEIPFILRYLKNEECQEEDFVFVNSDGRLAKYMEKMDIHIN